MPVLPALCLYPLQSIVLPYRQLLFKCKVNEVEEDRLKSHPRFIFVFNDMLLVTKPRRQDYQFRSLISLLGALVLKFETSGEPHLSQAVREVGSTVCLSLCLFSQDTVIVWMYTAPSTVGPCSCAAVTARKPRLS